MVFFESVTSLAGSHYAYLVTSQIVKPGVRKTSLLVSGVVPSDAEDRNVHRSRKGLKKGKE